MSLFNKENWVDWSTLNFAGRKREEEGPVYITEYEACHYAYPNLANVRVIPNTFRGDSNAFFPSEPARTIERKHTGLFEKEEDTVVCHHNPYGGLFGDDKLRSVFEEGYKEGYLEAKRKYDN